MAYDSKTLAAVKIDIPVWQAHPIRPWTPLHDPCHSHSCKYRFSFRTRGDGIELAHLEHNIVGPSDTNGPFAFRLLNADAVLCDPQNALDGHFLAGIFFSIVRHLAQRRLGSS